MIKEFRDFIARGNVIDLAVAVIIGVAFGAVVSEFTNGVLMNLIAAVGGKPDFSDLTLGIGDGVILYGVFLTAVVNFLLIAFALFIVVKAVAAMQRPRADAVQDSPTPTGEEVLLTEIRDLLRAQSGGRAERA